jgi:hypothetical protein
VPRLGGANEVVVGELQRPRELPPVVRQPVAIRLRILAFALRDLLDLLPMFIEARQKERVVAEAALRACDHIRGDFFIGMAQVGLAVDVIDRGRDVEPFAHPRAVWGRRGRLAMQGGAQSIPLSEALSEALSKGCLPKGPL